MSEDRLTLGLVLDQPISVEHRDHRARQLPAGFGLFAAASAARRSRTGSRIWRSRRRTRKTRSRRFPAATSSAWCSPNGWRRSRSVLILDSPTVGVDISAKDGIYEIVKRACGERRRDAADLGRNPRGALSQPSRAGDAQGRLAARVRPAQFSEAELQAAVDA